MRLAALGVIAITATIAIIFSLNNNFSKSGFLVKSFPDEEFFNFSVHFCAFGDCPKALSSALNNAKFSVSCAFYRADDYVLGNISGSAAATIILDKKARISNAGNASIFRASSKGIMHNKYCILDNSAVMTGSFNPTSTGSNDYNNLLVINSTSLAAIYSLNLESLKRGVPLRGKNSVKISQTLVEVYFCPYDDCVEAVKQELSLASESVYFAAYSFTHPEIANELILKAAEGVTVSGIFEKSTTGSEYSKHRILAANGVDVKVEKSKRLMHHKFFVVDNQTIVTGSFNPTKNAAERNDENVIIVHDGKLAGLYVGEFDRIMSEG